jgi:hypothetical protein
MLLLEVYCDLFFIGNGIDLENVLQIYPERLLDSPKMPDSLKK